MLPQDSDNLLAGESAMLNFLVLKLSQNELQAELDRGGKITIRLQQMNRLLILCGDNTHPEHQSNRREE